MSSLDEITRHEKFPQIQKEKVRLYHWPSPQYLLDDSLSQVASSVVLMLQKTHFLSKQT